MDKDIQKAITEYYAVDMAIRHLYEQWSKQQGLSYHELFILCAVWDNGYECLQKQIVCDWTIPKQTVNTVLKGFEKKGLVTLETLCGDKRSKTVRFTPAGREYVDSIIKKLDDIEGAVLLKMGSEARRAMIESAKLFANTFKEVMGEIK